MWIGRLSSGGVWAGIGSSTRVGFLSIGLFLFLDEEAVYADRDMLDGWIDRYLYIMEVDWKEGDENTRGMLGNYHLYTGTHKHNL